MAPGTDAGPAAAGPARRGRFPLRDRPGIAWLGLAGLLTLVHPFVPGADWLLVHLVLLGALTHSAMVWSTHFTQAILRTPDSTDDRTQQNRRIIVLLGGATFVLVGVPSGMWPVTVAGASGVAVAVGWHGIALWRRLGRALPGRFRISVRYYLAAACAVPVGAGFGAWLARGVDDDWHGRLLVAHSMTMVLGWLGLTVTGTLVTLWPTMLRTRMDARAERFARQSLPLLLASLGVLDVGAVAGLRVVALAGLAGYVAGLVWWGRALLCPARQAPPRSFATWSVTAGLVWGVIAVLSVAWRLATSDSWAAVADGYGLVAALIAAGFAVQLLFGALSHLIPVVLGGGPSVARAASAWFDRACVWRVVVVQLGLVIAALPAPPTVRIGASALVVGALGMFVPLLLCATRAAVTARRALIAGITPATPDAGDAGAGEHARVRPARVAATPSRDTSLPVPHRRAGQVGAALSTVALVVALGVALAPAIAGDDRATPASATSLDAGVAPTGHTTRVRVEARDMAFVPASVSVPAGDRLVIDLLNTDTGSPHDLTFTDGARTPRVMPGHSATLDVGVVGASTEAWCSIVGHRQMGMVLRVTATGAPAHATEQDPAASDSGAGTDTSTAGRVDLNGTFPPAFRAADATLSPLSADRIHHVTLHVREAELEVAPGVRQKRWTFDGTVPGPTLHGHVGDRFVVTVVNDASMGHSVDFHAGERAPDVVMGTVAPGKSLTYAFTAERAGIWMYHCSTMPMTAHIGAGLFGAVIIEPPGLPPVDHSYVLVESEVFLDGDGASTVREVDAAKAAADTPDAVTFNGVANQYTARPLTTRAGQRVRIWVLAAGPSRGSAFHVVGSQFDTAWKEGAYLLDHGRGPLGGRSGGAQVLDLGPAQGGFIELAPKEPGHYPFVTHAMADAERGARGVLAVAP